MICLVRKKQVVATPEEKIRQACLKWMVETLKYPLEGIVVEKGIKELFPLLDLPFPNRRLDILVTSRCRPLLVVECKAVKTTPQALSQLLGYHHWLGTSYAALADPIGIQTIILKEGETHLMKGLPSYTDL